MKIEITKTRDLDALSRIVKPGDVLESPKDAPEELLQAYVNNGIARDISEPDNSKSKIHNSKLPSPGGE